MRRKTIFGIWTGVAVMVTALLAVPCVLANPVWPSPPDTARVEFVREIRCEDLSPDTGFWGSIGRFLGGGSPQDQLFRPFDVLPVDGHLYMTCQDFPALVRVDVAEGSFKLFRCDDPPLQAPVALAASDETVFLSDSGNGTIYRLHEDDLEPWVTTGLERPTGIALGPKGERLFVVDTGDHKVKVFDLNGDRVTDTGGRGEAEEGLNFPTFAAESDAGVLVNDTMNYRVKTFDEEGRLLGSFGEEGNGPGTFARPKGLLNDSAGNIWVVDALFDNIQIFDSQGRLLLIVGGSGHDPGEFWSPAGIGMSGDLVYVADTFNNRIQVLRTLGGGS